jgi:hypothetical protein
MNKDKLIKKVKAKLFKESATRKTVESVNDYFKSSFKNLGLEEKKGGRPSISWSDKNVKEMGGSLLSFWSSDFKGKKYTYTLQIGNKYYLSIQTEDKSPHDLGKSKSFNDLDQMFNYVKKLEKDEK